MADRLAGQVALVTGSNRGIGQQIAIDLAKAGATVVLSARRAESLAATAAAIEAAGGACDRVQLDVTDAAMVATVVDGIVARHGRIDLLVNNAGIGAGDLPPWETPIDSWWEVFEVNVRGVFVCTQGVMRHMARQRSGRIIDVGSLVSANPNPAAAPYAASKAALQRWNSSLAPAAAEVGVSVFVISPGLVATDMTAIDRFKDIPADQWVPIEKSGALAVALASGRGDKLSGRFIHALDDLDELIEHADEIIERNQQTLAMQFYDEEL
ncbi:MAG: SDR family oxidoreductase [Pseudomonadota bacterium]